MPLTQDEIQEKANELKGILLQFLNSATEQNIKPEELINQIERRYSVTIVNIRYNWNSPRKNELQVYFNTAKKTFVCNFGEKRNVELQGLSPATQEYIKNIAHNHDYMKDHAGSVEIQENEPVADILKKAASSGITLSYYVEDFADQAAVLKCFLESGYEFTNLSKQQAEKLNRLYVGLVCAYEKARSVAQMQPIQLISTTENSEPTSNQSIEEEKSDMAEKQPLLTPTSTSNHVDSEVKQGLFTEPLRKKLYTYSLSTAVSPIIHKAETVTGGAAFAAAVPTVLTGGLAWPAFFVCAPSILLDIAARIIDIPLRAMPGYRERYGLYVDMILKMVFENKVDNASFKRRLEAGENYFLKKTHTNTKEESDFPVRNEDIRTIKKAVNDLIRNAIWQPGLRLHYLENMLTSTQYVCALMDFEQSYHDVKMSGGALLSPKVKRYSGSHDGTTRKGIFDEIKTAMCQCIDSVLTEGSLNLTEQIKTQLQQYKNNYCISILEMALDNYRDSTGQLTSYHNQNRESSIKNIQAAIEKIIETNNLNQLLSVVDSEMKKIKHECKNGTVFFPNSSTLYSRLDDAVKCIKKSSPSAAVVDDNTESMAQGNGIELASLVQKAYS